jgi:hypothetical protein
MKVLPFLILCFTTVAVADDFKTVQGKEYKNVTVSRVEPDGIVLKSKSGISKVYFVELPPDVQKRFQHDVTNTAHASERAANQTAYQTHGTQAKQPLAVGNTTGVDLPALPPIQETKDKITTEILEFRLKTRALYNASKFDELEALADQLRAERARFGNGSWKIYQFYDALECRYEEPESMWQLHSRIHENWDAAKPRSITARVAHADFFTAYAWRARGTDYSDKVTKEGWRLFDERLAQAAELLNKSAEFEPKCPMWWHVRMTVALGQGWSWDDHERLFQEAKAFEPEFWGYDVAKARYLLPRWHGQPGEWEYALSLENDRPKGLGMETYARVVNAMGGYYKNIFRETHASWPMTRDGFELMRQRYPDSLEILSRYCRFACLAEDRASARKLFDELSGRMIKNIWSDQESFRKYRDWAYSQSGAAPVTPSTTKSPQ